MPALLRRIIGAALLAFSFIPIFRLLDSDVDAPFRQTSVEVAEATLGYILWGVLTAGLLGVLLALFIPRERLVGWTDRIGNRLATIRPGAWALSLAAWSTAATWLIGRFLFEGFYTNVDEIASALQARYFAVGSIAGDLPGPSEAWLIPNMLMVDAGWVSQFPPSHLALMALGILVGAPMIVGPVLFGMMAGLSALVFPRLMPETPRAARVAALAVGVSPFLLFIGAGALSHTSAGAFGFLALYAALRARDGGPAWSLLAGGAIGVMVASRPWIGLILGTMATLGIWLPELRGRSSSVACTSRWFAARAVGTVVGGAPFAVALGLYNRALFGSATTLGYLAAFGERHRLGFHPDPWGYGYSPIDAVGFTSTDMLSFGTQLLETPIPVGAVIGLWLVRTRLLPRGTGFLLAWALVPVVANGLYWFHSIRMLYEAAPAWLALACLAVSPLLGGVEARASPRRLEARGAAIWSVVVALVLAVTLGVPERVSSFAWSDDTIARVTVPSMPGGAPALVFVHTSWNERMSATLQGVGEMRQDSVIGVLRRNTNCSLNAYAVAREARASGGPATLPTIDLEQSPGMPPDIVWLPTSEATTLRTRTGEQFSTACIRELDADRFGAVALAPLLWQGDLPGAESGRPLFIRDLGPEKNARVQSRFPERTSWVFVPRSDGAAPELVAYQEAMRVLWGGE